MNKQKILDEIRRTAKTNSGVPLGRDRFERETGIKESDWSGRFWARWSDAVKEAGFEPNRMVSAYEEEFLLEQYVSLIRELGRLPVNPEVRMKRREDPTFPNEKTFARFGNKAQLANKLAEYCRSKTGYEDILTLCGTTQTIAKREDADNGKENEIEFGFVYLIKSGRYYKVGRSNAVGRREREIALQLPEKANTVHIIRTDDPPGIEAYWHQRFMDRRKNGEWFELSAVDVKAFKRRKFM
jgi:hypothetical protein